MADKAECPACKSYTSGIALAQRRGDDCPHCGLPAHAARAIVDAIKRGADADLAQRAAKAEARADRLQAEVGRLRYVVDETKGLIENLESVTPIGGEQG